MNVTKMLEGSRCDVGENYVESLSLQRYELSGLQVSIWHADNRPVPTISGSAATEEKCEPFKSAWGNACQSVNTTSN